MDLGVPFLFSVTVFASGLLISNANYLPAFIGALFVGLYFSDLQVLALAPLTLLIISSYGLQAPLNRTLKAASHIVFLLTALGLVLHKWPGFSNFLFFDKHTFSQNSSSFTMYFNYDKVLIGLLLLSVTGWGLSPQSTSNKERLRSFLAIAGIMLPCLISLAVLFGYISWDLKAPKLWYIWILNNFFFICLAEEALFRVYLIESLERLPLKSKHLTPLALLISSVLFGLVHFKGGVLYILLSTVAGLFYGYTYIKFRHIKYAMAMHLLLNTVHFFFFTYPFKA